MTNIRKAQERGHADHGWLNSRHTFSFADYHDPNFMGFRELRVINEDRVRPGAGFGTHPHRDMEIISYVVEGALEHEDSMGNGSIIRPGDVQRMSAGSGVTHSEFNHSKEQPVRFLQIWIKPSVNGLEPSYEQKNYDTNGRLRLVVSPGGTDGSLTIHQDASLYASMLSAGEEVAHSLAAGRHAWLQVIDGEVTLNGDTLCAGDGGSLQAAVVNAQTTLTIQATQQAHFLLFDIA